jgi:DNA polymerase
VNFKGGQSPGFDVMKMAMLEVDREYYKRGLRSRVCGQVHDEIITLAPDCEVSQVISIKESALKKDLWHFNSKFPHNIPLDCEVQVGQNYGELEAWAPGEVHYENITRGDASAGESVTSVNNSTETFGKIISEVLPCQLCSVFEGKGWQKSPPEGSIRAPVTLMWLTSNPGEDEFEQSRPFVGRGGSLVRQYAYIEGLSLPPDPSTFVTYALWCHSIKSDSITSTHINNCRTHLDRILALTRPRVIIALGSIAARAILRHREVGLEGIIGRWHDTGTGTRVMVTYHPNFLLRSPGYTPEFQKHLAEVRSVLSSL